jgi:predicted nucleic acid-binding protein
VIVVDTSFVVALLDRRDGNHHRGVDWYAETDDELATTPLVLAEVDYLAAAHGGAVARDAFRRDAAAGAYAADWWPGAAAEAVAVAERYGSLGVSLTDASLVALAGRLSTARVATFDERHFRAMQPVAGAAAFTLLPADA